MTPIASTGMNLNQVWYQNPDTSMAYLLLNDDEEVVGYGGQIEEGAVLLPDATAIDDARAELATIQAENIAAVAAEAEALEAARHAEAEAAAAAAASAVEKFVGLGLTQEEAVAVVGYDPQEGEPLAPEEQP